MKKEKHFAFGQNWSKYSRAINSQRILEATKNIERLLGNIKLANFTVLDIGSGSGIHDVAFLRMGCKFLEAIDYDLDSVRTTENTIEQNYTGDNYRVYKDDILNLKNLTDKKFNLVYSWGVLHHTGDLSNAIKNSCLLVETDGYFAIAVYRKTRLCNFWRIEKKLYSHSPRFIQLIFEFIYVFIFALRFTSKYRKTSIFQYVSSYEQFRGMKWIYDVRDWLGGYPYESISASDLKQKFSDLGFVLVNEFSSLPEMGLLGTGCDEFLFRKT